MLISQVKLSKHRNNQPDRWNPFSQSAQHQKFYHSNAEVQYNRENPYVHRFKSLSKAKNIKSIRITPSRMHELSACYISTTDLHIYILDVVPPVHVVWNHVDADTWNLG